MQGLIGLEVRPVDENQRLPDARERHPTQGRIDRARLVLQMAIAQQAVGALDLVAQPACARKASPHIGQRQTRTAHARDHRGQQRRQASAVDVLQQRLQASV